MTDWGEVPTRHDLWLRLMSLTDELQHIADQWLLYDMEIRELQGLYDSDQDQYDLPFDNQKANQPAE